MEQQTGSTLGKEYVKAVYCHPADLSYMQSISYEMLGWMNHKLIAGRKINNLRYADDTTLMAEIKEEVKKEESGKGDLKPNIHKTKIMASGPITSCQIDGGKVEIVTDFIFLGSKITIEDDCRHKIKRCLLLGGKAMTNLDIILKSRDISLLTKVHIVKIIILPLIMYGCES